MWIKTLASIMLFAFLTDSAHAQRRDVYADPENLTVLSRGISPAELASVMRRYKLALGVECSYCHQGTDNRSYSDFDFASDSKESKQIARAMVQMVTAVNAMIMGLDRGPDHQVTEVTCVTCHRGNFRPQMIQDVLAATYAESGGDIDAVIVTYQELREQNYGGFAFDFGEFPVSGFAFRLDREGHSQDAIKLQKMNERFHPESPDIPSGMGFIYRNAGQLELAAGAFRRSLAIKPDGRWVADQLSEVEALIAAQE